jgi:hypothetical protein
MADAKHMARAIVASSMKTLSMQRMRLLAAVIVVPVLAFLPRTMSHPCLSHIFTQHLLL